MPGISADSPRDAELELAGGEIIEEEQRLGALHNEIVDAHGDEIDADRVVPAGEDGELELGADAVGSGDQDGVAVARGFQIEERAETAQSGVAAGARGRLGERLDRLHQRIAGIDIDAGVAIILALYGALDRYRLLPRRRRGTGTIGLMRNG